MYRLQPEPGSEMSNQVAGQPIELKPVPIWRWVVAGAVLVVSIGLTIATGIWGFLLLGVFEPAVPYSAVNRSIKRLVGQTRWRDPAA
jgi:hypothetical protein